MTQTTTLAPPNTIALPRQRHPAPPGAVTAILVFANRAALKIRRTPEQMADALLIPIIFTLLFTYLFGGALAGSTRDYLDTLLPGTLVMTVLLVTVYTGTMLKTDVDNGVHDRVRSLPVWRPAAVLGAMLGDLVRYLIAGGLVLALGLVMGFRPAGGAAGVVSALAVVLVFAFSLSWVWTTLALLVRTPAALSTLSFVVQFPLLFASNVFVDPQTMPSWLRHFVDANPVSHLVTAVRALIDGTVSSWQVGGVLIASAGIVAVFAPLTMRLYARKA
jgi:ABC-2 type transport system permease protein